MKLFRWIAAIAIAAVLVTTVGADPSVTDTRMLTQPGLIPQFPALPLEMRVNFCAVGVILDFSARERQPHLRRFPAGTGLCELQA